jgi:hypothetical protein
MFEHYDNGIEKRKDIELNERFYLPNTADKTEKCDDDDHIREVKLDLRKGS